MAGALSGVHRLAVAKPHPFKPIEERKHGGETHDVHGKAHHHKLGRKRGGSVKKKSDGGNVTTVAKTSTSNPPADKSLSGPFNRARELQGPLDQMGTWGVKPSYEWHDEARKSGPKAQDSLSRAKGGHVGHRDVDTPDRGTKYGTPVQDVPMAGTESGYGGKFAHGKGHVEDSLKDGGKVKWIQKAISHPHAEQNAAKKAGMSTHAFMEKHKHDSGKSGARARLGLRLSAMAKHKKHD